MNYNPAVVQMQKRKPTSNFQHIGTSQHPIISEGIIEGQLPSLAKDHLLLKNMLLHYAQHDGPILPEKIIQISLFFFLFFSHVAPPHVGGRPYKPCARLRRRGAAAPVS